jgi:hypothetical protein
MPTRRPTTAVRGVGRSYSPWRFQLHGGGEDALEKGCPDMDFYVTLVFFYIRKQLTDDVSVFLRTMVLEPSRPLAILLVEIYGWNNPQNNGQINNSA